MKILPINNNYNKPQFKGTNIRKLDSDNTAFARAILEPLRKIYK